MESNIRAEELNFEHIGAVVTFMDGDHLVHGEIREISHSSEATWIWVLDHVAYRKDNFSYKEYELSHTAVIGLIGE